MLEILNRAMTLKYAGATDIEVRTLLITMLINGPKATNTYRVHFMDGSVTAIDGDTAHKAFINAGMSTAGVDYYEHLPATISAMDVSAGLLDDDPITTLVKVQKVCDLLLRSLVNMPNEEG